MKTYQLKNYNSFKDFQDDFIKDINDAFIDTEVSSPKFTDCEIVGIEKWTNTNDDVLVEISRKGGFTTFVFRMAVEKGFLILPEDKVKIFNDFMNSLDKVLEEHRIKMAEESRIAQEHYAELIKKREVLIAKKEAERLEKEAERKFKQKIEKSILDFELKVNAPIKIEQDPIEWLRTNVISISATIPSHLEKSFLKQFGEEAPYTLIDSSRKTSGGYSMKFGPSFRLTVKKDTPIHPALTKLFRDNIMNDTSFIARLVKRYDFHFGKQS